MPVWRVRHFAAPNTGGRQGIEPLPQLTLQEFIGSAMGESSSGGVVVRAIVPREGVI